MRALRRVPVRALALAVLGLIAAVRVWDPWPVETLRLRTFDAYQMVQPRANPAFPVVIVDVDEQSLAAVGQWPWPRATLAALVERLFRQGAVVVGFDMLFPEPDRMSPEMLARALPDLSPRVRAELQDMPGGDPAFAAAIARGPVALGRAAIPGAPAAAAPGAGPKAALAEIGGNPRPFLTRYAASVSNLPLLERAAGGLGMITMHVERDNVIRRVPTLFRVGDAVYPTLGIEMLRLAERQSTVAVRVTEAGIDGLVLSRLRVPTDDGGRVWIRFAKSDGRRYVPAARVLDGTVAPERIAGKIVLVGVSAAGLFDVKATPIAPAMPGVEVHAQLIESILAGTSLIRPSYALGAELVLLVAVGLLIVWLTPMVGAWWTSAIAAGIVAALAGGSWLLYAGRNVLVDVSYPIAGAFVLYTLLSFSNYLAEESRRRTTRNAFSLYLSPTLVDRLVADPKGPVLEGEERTVTIMFSDVVGFTRLSERLDPVGLTGLVNRVLTPQTEAIHRHAGTIDKFTGDGLMAFWNAPLDDADHPRHACLAALAMQAEMAALDRELGAAAAAAGRDHAPLRIGIGINTGPCYVGNMGSRTRFAYSLMGIEVNLAQRIEGQTRTYGVGTIVAANTAARAPDLAFLDLGLVRVVGASSALRIHALLGDATLAGDPGFRALCEAQAAMLAAYRSRQWDAAERALERCRRADPGLALGALYDRYAGWIAAWRLAPPAADWDGAHAAESK